MTYRLIIGEDVSKAVAAMDAVTHELFVLAALDLPRDPHMLGWVVQADGTHSTRAHTLGGLGFIVYDVDEDTRTVTAIRIVWVG